MTQAQTPSGFPTPQPALITKVHISELNDIDLMLSALLNAVIVHSCSDNPDRITGVTHNGSRLMHFATPTGTIETLPGFEPALKAEVNFGAEWLSFDPDGTHGRIDLRGIAKTEAGHSIDFRYQGIIEMAPEVKKIFEMHPDAATVPFGFATGQHQFLVADPALKKLENSVFVSNGRIKVHEKGLTVETRQSLVVAATVMD